jgi:hypothetical protein
MKARYRLKIIRVERELRFTLVYQISKIIYTNSKSKRNNNIEKSYFLDMID